MGTEKLKQLIEAAERPMLMLAALAVGIYLVDLQGLWLSLGVRDAYLVAALVIDLIFVADLCLKLAADGRQYVRTPWFVVDFLCALPILSTLAAAPSVLQSLRFVRMFRILRAVRMLRMLRALRVLRFLQDGRRESRETLAYHRAIRVAVISYAVVFVFIVAWGRQSAPPGEIIEVGGIALPETHLVTVRADDGSIEELELPVAQVYGHANRTELFLVTGSVLGMILILGVSRFQIPALWSRQIDALLNVALPLQVAKHFLANPDAYDDDCRAPATVIFCDIKGFTSTVETLPLDELKRHLERALDAIVDAHMRQDLIIDKFIGDAVMSFRGGNLVPGSPAEHAYRVVRGALDGVRALRELGDPYFSEVKVGGASAMDTLIGTFGTSKRLSYTVLGDGVNLAARLESSCNALGVATLFCGRTRELVGDRDDLRWRRIGALIVQGREEPTMTFEAFDVSEPLEWIQSFHEALSAFEAARFEGAADAFAAVDAARPGGDVPARLYAERARVLASEGVGEGWTATLRTRK